jgi:GNAT superfamily N-acetyltransferase
VDVRRIEGSEMLERYAAVHNAVNPDDAVAVGDVRGWTASLRDSAFFAVGDVAVGWVALDWRPVPEARILVLAGRRRRGVGSALFAEVCAWAAARGHGELEGRVRESHADGLAFAEHRGFVEIGREQGLELDLTAAEAPTVRLPEGVAITSWAERPDATEGLYAVYCEAVPDVPGEEDTELEPLDVWLEHHMGGPGDRPEATFVAFAGDEVVGFSKFSLSDAQPTTAYHDLTGVKREWRGRGVAGALKAAQIRWAVEAGYERLRTQIEERNAPIRRLNERFGYRPAQGRVLLRGPVASAGP